MSTAAGSPALRVARISPWSRLYGLGSVYAKTLRDSRLAFLIMAGLLGGIMLTACKAFSTAYSTPASRVDMVRLATDLPPILKGLSLEPVNVDTLGGFVAWKYGVIFPLIAGLWSIVALSGTLAAEARSGSLDIIAASPFGKRRIALEKLAAHVTGMAGVMIFLGVVTYLAAAAFGTIKPGDDIPVAAAVGFGLRVGLIGLVSGAVAWALAPFLGRASAAGIAGAVMLGGYLVSMYQASVPALRPLADLSWFHWAAQQNPLAGQYDWLSMVPVALVALVLFAVGVEAFGRRDLGSSSAIPIPAMPGALLGTREPIGRAFGERLPVAIAWGLGLAIYAAIMGGSSAGFANELHNSPATLDLLKIAFPRFDPASAGGFLQIMFVIFGFIMAGLGAATLVSGWASDEQDRRLEMLLATPMGRVRWTIASGLGVFAAIAAMTALAIGGIALGGLVAGGDVATPMLGGLTLWLWACAAAGIGFAVGGLWRTSIAAEITAVFVIATFLIGTLGEPLKAPSWFNGLALTSHLGEPMVGVWDPVGIVACLVIAFGGLLLGAWGMRRRDVS
jgi:ABC-2 type transport system permease protein